MSLLGTLIQAAKGAGLDTRRIFQALSAASLDAAAAEQELAPLRARLREIVPDIGDWYNEVFDLVISVPFVRQSRVGLQFRRADSNRPARITAERVHIFELWSTVFGRIYRRYPRRSPLRCMAPIWRRLDFEGFSASRSGAT